MRLRCFLAALFGLTVLTGEALAAICELVVQEQERQRVALDRDYFDRPRVNLAVFDGNALRWLDEPLAVEAGCSAQALLAQPRVVLLRCATGHAAMVGHGSGNAPRWRRRLGNERVIGVDSTGLLLSSGELINPGTGEARPLVNPRPGRQLAAWSTSGAVYAYDPTAIESRHAGIVRWSSEAGSPELVIERTGSWFRRAPNVEAMTLDDSERYLLIVERPDWRGPTWIGLAVYDLRTGEQVHQQRLDDDCVCQDGRMIKGKDGLIGVSYHNVTAGAYVLVTFRVRTADSANRGTE